jgi:site-specific recombinase XerD
MNKVNLSFYPNKAKKSIKTGKIPIYMRLYGAGKHEVRLNSLYDLTSQELFKWNEFSQQMDDKDSDTNLYISEIKKRFKALKTDALLNGATYTLTEIRDIVLLKRAEVKQQPTVYNYAATYLINDIENNNNKKEGTKKNYRNAINQLQHYLKHIGKEHCMFTEFDFTLADGFKKYLESTLPSLPDKVKNTEVSSSTKIKNIKPIFTRAFHEGLITRNPFEKIKLVYEKVEVAYSMNIVQVNSIYNLDITNNPSLEFIKDFFLFMCFTGLSYGDAIAFSKDDISRLTGNRIYYRENRKKTGTRIKQVLIFHAQQIVEKYLEKGYSYSENRIFPQLTGETINIKLKVLAARAGISEIISTKTGRITCSELLNAAGIEEQLLVHSYMGWSNGKNIRRRYLNISDEKLLRFSERFENYISENLSVAK